MLSERGERCLSTLFPFTSYPSFSILHSLSPHTHSPLLCPFDLNRSQRSTRSGQSRSPSSFWIPEYLRRATKTDSVSAPKFGASFFPPCGATPASTLGRFFSPSRPHSLTIFSGSLAGLALSSSSTSPPYLTIPYLSTSSSSVHLAALSSALFIYLQGHRCSSFARPLPRILQLPSRLCFKLQPFCLRSILRSYTVQ